ncbi:MAG: hypothetical protein BWX62_01175 [Bacteroidetes bacterium ADurb.Bin037]|nr:MAG: hypothetical protein BWX62_01175 [Bacteroidetes bacterium ADurb.Bin037]
MPADKRLPDLRFAPCFLYIFNRVYGFQYVVDLLDKTVVNLATIHDVE